MPLFVSPPDLWDSATLDAIASGAFVLQAGQRFRCGADDRATHVLDRVRVSGRDPDGRPYVDFRAFHGPRATDQRRQFLASQRTADKRTECNRIARELQAAARSREFDRLASMDDDDDSAIPGEDVTAWDIMCGAIMGIAQ